jgi:hypothetical protein
MGCLVNLIKIILGLIMIAIMLIVGYKLIFDPYRPESPNSSWSHRPVAEQTYSKSDGGEYKAKEENYDFRTNVPVQVGENHDYIMENTIQKGYVVMELTPALERGLVYVIKVFKSQFGEDFAPTIISAHDSFDRHDKWSHHKTGRAVDISLVDLPYYKRRRVVKILEGTLPKEYKVEWKCQGTVNEHLHFQSRH